MILTKPKRINRILIRNNFNKLRLTSRKIGYHFHYPISVFTKDSVKLLGDKKAIEKILSNRNPYYIIFSKDRRDLLIERINSLEVIKEFIDMKIREVMPNVDVISVYVYGGYIYANKNYIPEDIDMGVVVEGNLFKYFPKILIPPLLSRKLGVPVQYLSINFLGKENFEKGILVNKRVSYRDTEIKREASIGYRRNVVIEGKDFIYRKNNLYNAYTSKVEMLIRCYLRINKWGRYGKESDEKRFNKLASRLYSLSVFLKFFNPNTSIDWEKASMLSVSVQNKKLNYKEIIQWYEILVKEYNLLENDILPECCSKFKN